MRKYSSYRLEHIFKDTFMASQYFGMMNLIYQELEMEKEAYKKANKKAKKK